jgi:hypothetical protein
LQEHCLRTSRNGKKPDFFGLRVVRNRVFGENTWLQPAATAKTRFLWFGFFGFDA